LPIANHLVAKDKDGQLQPISSDKYYVPPSVLQVRVDPAELIALF
jgi:hypothetical protein